MKKVIRITESKLNQMIVESVKKILEESNDEFPQIDSLPNPIDIVTYLRMIDGEKFHSSKYDFDTRYQEIENEIHGENPHYVNYGINANGEKTAYMITNFNGKKYTVCDDSF